MNKLNFHRWLNKPIKYSDNINLDIVTLLYNDIVDIIKDYNDIDFIDSYNLFENFCKHFYNEYVYPYNAIDITNFDDKDYIELYCEQDVVDIFTYYKNNFNIFPNISSSYPLLVFLVNNCNVYDISNDDDDSSDNDEYYIY